ncbi:MAG TPA: hypothetical protein VKI65_10515 [Gemmataceae bacterium]|nr:hypothetical protein [Gemmataceae bacterium]
MCLPRGRFFAIMLLLLAASLPARSEPPAEKKPPVRLDRYGDPLPEGAIARLGTVRLRHASRVYTLCYFPDGKTLVSAGRTIRLWDVANGKALRQLWCQHSTIFCVAVSPDGRMIAEIGTAPGAGPDDVIHLRDATTGKEVGQLPGDNSWDAVHGKALQPVPRHLSLVAFAPDGKTLASASNPFPGRGRGAAERAGVIRLWDISSKKELRTFQSGAGPVRSLQFSPSGTLLAWAGDDPLLVLEDVAKGKELGRFKLPHGSYGAGALSPDGKVVALGRCELVPSPTGGTDVDCSVEFQDLASGRLLRRFKVNPNRIFALSFSPDGETLASAGGDNRIRLWEAATGRPALPLQGHVSGITALAFGPEGRELVAADRGGSVRVWEPATGKELRVLGKTPNSQLGIALSRDGKILALAAGPRLWDMATGKDLSQFPVLQWWGESVALSPDGTILAGAWNDAIRLWDVRTGKELRRFGAGGSASKAALALSPDGLVLAVLNRGGFRPWTRISLWSTTTGEKLRGWDESADFFSPAFSPDGKTLATGGDDGTVRLWAVATGQEIRRFGTQGREYQARVHAVAFSPNGKTLATGKPDGTMHLWEVATGQEICQFVGHESGINCVAFSPDGRTLASGSDDAMILIWVVAGPGHPNLSRATPLAVAELQRLWVELGDLDARKGHQALWRLVAAPAQATTFLRQRLPAAVTATQRVERIITNLDHADPAVREQAFEELVKLGSAAGPALQEALAGQPSEEVRRQADRLLANMRGPSAKTSLKLRALRAIEVLEHIGTPEAQALLKDLAKGAPEARLTQEAKASLERLAKRSRADR